MGGGASKNPCPERVHIPLDDAPASRCATVKPRPKGRCLIRYDASSDSFEAELVAPPERLLEPGETLKLRIAGKEVAARVGESCRHAPGTRLMVLLGGELVLATVLKRLAGNQHRLQLDDQSAVVSDLNAWNHSVSGAFSTVDAYKHACQAYVKQLHERLSTVEDGITGHSLALKDQARARTHPPSERCAHTTRLGLT